MKIRVALLVDIDEKGLAEYYAKYPDFVTEFQETPLETLIREASAAWDFESLLAADPEPDPDPEDVLTEA